LVFDLSFSPGFSPVMSVEDYENRFNGFSLLLKILRIVGVSSGADSALKTVETVHPIGGGIGSPG
jgi:hypothetical protein